MQVKKFVLKFTDKEFILTEEDYKKCLETWKMNDTAVLKDGRAFNRKFLLHVEELKHPDAYQHFDERYMLNGDVSRADWGKVRDVLKDKYNWKFDEDGKVIKL